MIITAFQMIILFYRDAGTIHFRDLKDPSKLICSFCVNPHKLGFTFVPPSKQSLIMYLDRKQNRLYSLDCSGPHPERGNLPPVDLGAAWGRM